MENGVSAENILALTETDPEILISGVKIIT
jgi:hypothetical protein